MADKKSDEPSEGSEHYGHASIADDTGHSGIVNHLNSRDHGILERAIRGRVSRLVGAGHPETHADAAVVDELCFDPRLNPELDPQARQLPGTDKAIAYRSVLLQALIDPDPRRYREVIADLAGMGVPMQTLAIQLFSPVAARLGDRWCEDEADFMLVAVASTRLSMIINHLSHMTSRPVRETKAERRVLLARTRRAIHTIGVAIVASCFRDMGWIVDGGIDLEVDDTLHAKLASTPYDMLGISIGQVDDVEECSRTIKRVQSNPMTKRVKIAVGGPAVFTNPTLSTISVPISSPIPPCRSCASRNAFPPDHAVRAIIPREQGSRTGWHRIPHSRPTLHCAGRVRSGTPPEHCRHGAKLSARTPPLFGVSQIQWLPLTCCR